MRPVNPVSQAFTAVKPTNTLPAGAATATLTVKSKTNSNRTDAVYRKRAKITNAQLAKLERAGDEEGVLFEEAESAVPRNVLREKQDDNVAENERQGQGHGR